MIGDPLGSVRADDQAAPFLDGAGRGEFMLRRCRNCAAHGGPQEEACPACGSVEVDWVAAGGGARLVSWSVVYGRDHDGTPSPRSIVAIAELDEGPWWWSQVVGAEPDQMHTGCRLTITFAESPSGYSLPVFGVA